MTKILVDKFPDLEVPKLTDLDRQGIDFDVSDGGDGCFAVASGDFSGHKNKDLAVLLKPSGDGSPQLVIALVHGKTWDIYQLPTFCNEITYCYVKQGKPGVYTRSEALDSPPTRPNELEKLTSKKAVVLSGRLESTGIAYLYSKGQWSYVWFSD